MTAKITVLALLALILWGYVVGPLVSTFQQSIAGEGGAFRDALDALDRRYPVGAALDGLGAVPVPCAQNPRQAHCRPITAAEGDSPESIARQRAARASMPGSDSYDQLPCPENPRQPHCAPQKSSDTVVCRAFPRIGLTPAGQECRKKSEWAAMDARRASARIGIQKPTPRRRPSGGGGSSGDGSSGGDGGGYSLEVTSADGTIRSQANDGVNFHLTDVSNLTVSGGTFSNAPVNGIALLGTTVSNVTIDGVTIQSATNRGILSLATNLSGTTIRNSTVTGSGVNGIEIFGSTVTGLTISSNTISSNTGRGADLATAVGAAGAVTSSWNTYSGNTNVGLRGTGTLVNSSGDVFSANNSATGVCDEVNAGPGPVSDPAADPDDAGNPQWQNLNSRQ